MKKKKKIVATTLREGLSYEPVELAFGTSGLRGLVRDITNLEAYVAVKGFLAWMLEKGGLAPQGAVCLAGDLRPSTAALVPEEGYRGEILLAAARAVEDAGCSIRYLGRIPTPALVLYAMKRSAPAVMVTGSHVPFDRNGMKLTTPSGEVRKHDEAPILEAIRAAREKEYARALESSIFDERGMLRTEFRPGLPPEMAEAREEYIGRYASAFPAGTLSGRRLLVWQHSGVGRDLLPRLLADLGAEPISAGRSDSFVPVDTEAVSPEMLGAIQELVDSHGGAAIDAVVSTDGDGDRPLLLAVDGGTARFVPGDLLGLLTADYFAARHVAVPVSVNDAVDRHLLARGVAMTKTRIGSPHVIAGMKEVGWEANGGFLTAVSIAVPGGGALEPLPTRDAVLPILAVLYASLGRGMSVSALLGSLPRRFGRSAVLRDMPGDNAREMVRLLSPGDASIVEARFSLPGIAVDAVEGPTRTVDPSEPLSDELLGIRARVERYFTPENGFGEVGWINWLDGVRVGFANDEVAHLRPSGNAPEMRFYSNAATQARADAMAELGVAEHGVVRRMEREATERIALEGFRSAIRPLILHGVVQHYQWGGYEFIPGLLGVENPAREPFAELWMGAHPRGPAAAAVDDARIALDRLVASDPWRILGEDCALRSAGRLPYLFKVLDARVMASIQAHPSKRQAEEGFSRENAAGVAIDAPDRNYRDDNHKPEVHVALTDFWLLHGFRPLEEIAELLAPGRELAGLMSGFNERRRAAAGNPDARLSLLRELYERVMTMPQAEVDGLLEPLLARLEEEEGSGALGKDDPGFWAVRAAREFPGVGGHRDRGIVSIYLLNLVRLKPGQGTFQPAGTLHSYLEGANVELMANSDNVLRAGLTPKHVDVPELLATLTFWDGRPPILEGRATSETGREYETPADEFALERIDIVPGTPYSGGREHGADTLVVVEGAAAVVAGGRPLALARGGIALVPAGLPYSVAARAPRAVLFKAGIPGQR